MKFIERDELMKYKDKIRKDSIIAGLETSIRK